ncbi:MAG TPA: hypothetical protein VGM19_02895 [Armatimonadota bacterium]|jgi:ABC-type thiamine transport system substrate-binding protein
MKTKDWEDHLRQYALASKIAAAPYSPDAFEEMLAFLLSRKALAEVPEAQVRLPRLDRVFARALSRTSPRWGKEIKLLSTRCSFAQAAWWQSILRMSADEKPRTGGEVVVRTGLKTRPAR